MYRALPLKLVKGRNTVMKFAQLLLAIALVSAPLAQAEIRVVPVKFAPGKTATSIKASLKGDLTLDYQVTAKAGQRLGVTLRSRNLSTYFNVLPPMSDAALFIGSTSGNEYTGALEQDGVHTVRVYLMRNAARRKETSAYTLDIKLEDPPPATQKMSDAKVAFDRTLEWQGIRFHVTATNDGSINRLRVVPSGLEIDNQPITKTIDGVVTNAEVADLNIDGSPEVYIYVTSAGSGSFGSVVGYAANRRKSLSEIFLPPLEASSANTKGYMGHDEFAVVENILARRFPIYRDGDSNAKPTGGMRQLQYKLVAGEASWRLQLDRVSEF
jgi:hypothetical protein